MPLSRNDPRAWTEEERSFLRRNHDRMTRAEMAARLPGRTKNAVCGECYRMGLRSDGAEVARRRKQANMTKPRGWNLKTKGFAYTPQIDAQIIKLYFEDNLSGPRVAEIIGISKSQLTHRLAKIAPDRKKEERPKAEQMATRAIGLRVKPRVVRPGVEPKIENGISLLALRLNTCRYPIRGSGADILFCGQETDPERPYCTWCSSIAYEPANRQSKKIRPPRYA